jgi:glycerophosphoryl diester phosphodiesterase
MIKIISHRGDTSQFPENTLEAFVAAGEAGADGIELDIHMTKDGALVVHHDYYLGNPDNGDGLIPELDLAYIKSLTIQNNLHVPTLVEVFAKLDNTLHYELEVKAYTFEALQVVLDLVYTHNLEKSIEFTSPHPYILSRLKQLDPSLVAGHFSMPQPLWMNDTLYRAQCIAHATTGNLDVLHCQASAINEIFVQQAHAAGLRVHSANCDSDEDLARAIAAGVDQLSTNALAAALKATGAKTQASHR